MLITVRFYDWINGSNVDCRVCNMISGPIELNLHLNLDITPDLLLLL